MHEFAEQLLSHLKAIWRYRWVAVGVAWIVALGGWTGVYLTPDRYRVDARVYVDTQSVLRPLLTGLAVQPNVDQMVMMMSRTLISRPNLEKVIRMADLDIGLRTDDDRARMIDRLLREIVVQSAGRENLYTISFVDNDPQIAKRVVESLIEIFVNGSTSDKRKDSDSARRFIDEQLESYRQKLTAAENTIMEFKRQHIGQLPGDGLTYFARLNDAKNALRQAELELREAENSRDSIRQQLATSSRAAIPTPDDPRPVEVTKPESDLDIRIRSLEEKLDNLRLSYTEQHPDIVAIVPMIAQLKARKEAEERLLRQQEEADAKLQGSSSVSTAKVVNDPVYQQLTISLTEADANVAAKRTRAAEFSRRFAELQAGASAMPKIEADYTQLTRDYDVNKARYDELLKRRESAEITGDMESSDAALGFRVIDPPRVPHSPIFPNRPWLMTVVLLAALASGLGVAWLTSELRPTINDERRLRELTGLTVLGTVAMAPTDAQKARRWRGLAGLVLSALSLLSAYVALMAMLVLTMSRA